MQDKNLLLSRQNKYLFAKRIKKKTKNIKNKFHFALLLFMNSIFIFIILIISMHFIYKAKNENENKKEEEKSPIKIEYKMNHSYDELIKVLKNENDARLFLKNKTEYYFQKRMIFLRALGINYDESKLITFGDKINYLMIHESPEYKANMADKIKIHQYSKNILGKDICTPILKIYNNTDEINLEELPEKFVLKCNHGCGMNILCKNRTNFDFEKPKNL